MPESTPHSTNRDYGFLAIVALAIVIAIWLLLMPWVPAIASSALHRFHLRSASFLWWCVQNPIPSMYNFANRSEVREITPGLLDPIIAESDPRYVNHFPARKFTFADQRFLQLNDGTDRWFMIDTSYRGQTLRSHFHAEPVDSGGFRLNRLPVEDW